jgi:2-polyprenyl-3-methyl-5-hydroxy-6-metoxy-1,4-benzoquinol methylase
VFRDVTSDLEHNPGGATEPSNSDPAKSLKSYRRLGAHYRRYLYVREMCTNVRLADVGCGYGFGSMILEGTYSEYVGVDLNEEAVGWAVKSLAKATPDGSSVSFCNPSQFQLRYPEGHFDVVISFEVIEHLVDPLGWLAQMKKKVRSGGRLILSTPNGSLSQGRRSRYSSKFHVREYSALELESMLRGISNNVRLFREDRIDNLNLLWRRYISTFGNGTRRDSPASNRELFGFAHFVSNQFNGPFFWRIRPLRRRDFQRPDFSNIIAIICVED